MINNIDDIARVFGNPATFKQTGLVSIAPKKWSQNEIILYSVIGVFALIGIGLFILKSKELWGTKMRVKRMKKKLKPDPLLHNLILI